MRGLEKPNAGVGTHIENGRATEVQANVERFRLGNTYGHDNLDVETSDERTPGFILPEGGRSTVFIPPRCLDFGVARQSRRLGC